MLNNAKFNNCQDLEKYHNDMDRLISDAIQHLNLRSVSLSDNNADNVLPLLLYDVDH